MKVNIIHEIISRDNMHTALIHTPQPQPHTRCTDIREVNKGYSEFITTSFLFLHTGVKTVNDNYSDSVWCIGEESSSG